MVDPTRVAERQRQAGATTPVVPPADDSEEGRLLACALAAALLEYRRHLRGQDDDTEAAGPAVEWRLLARWEQMAASPSGGGRAWA
ncbi:MAG: hypothetical protein P8129_13275 [Anaerolineae bacterium]|jgi:hypothetical protein